MRSWRRSFSAFSRWIDSETTSRIRCVLLFSSSLSALSTHARYVQVIAPVRETAAQALAVLLPHMLPSSAVEVQRVLVDMVHQIGTVRSDADADKMKYIWQVRHSGLLGLKYFVAVQGQLVRGTGASSSSSAVKSEPTDGEDVKPSLETGGAVLRAVVDAALVGLRDQDDDVRSAGAATLIPLAEALVEQLPKKLKEVLDVLWACLGDLKDDLSSSVGGVMDLLGASTFVLPPSFPH